MDTGYLLDRRTAVPQIVGDHRDFLFVTGLGGTSRDISHLTGDGANLYALGGAMGAALSVGLGLALARPHTARGTDLEAMARGAGFKATATVGAEAQIGHGRAVLREPAHCSFVLLRVAPTEPPAFKRNMDAAATRLRMKASLA